MEPVVMTRFASGGDPGWPAFDDTYPAMVFGPSGSTVQSDPRARERRSWDAPGL
jgi:para-nitrobenzyl esterase